MIELLLSLLLGYVAYLKKSLTTSANVVAIILCFIITYYGGIVSYIILVATFLITVLAGTYKNAQRLAIIEDIHVKKKSRDYIQILANVLVGTIAIILFEFSSNSMYLVVYASVMASSLADSLASEIGIFSKNAYDVLTLKKIVKGMSGGVSLLGLVASLVGAFIIALIYSLFTNFDYLLFITMFGFIGSLIDSVLGSLIQVKYKCLKCKKITEQKVHCNQNTKHIKGINFVTNDLINLLNNISVFLLTILCYNLWR